MSRTEPRPPALRAAYAAPDPLLALEDDVLTAIVFGAGTPCPQDPRVVRVGLEPLAGTNRIEIWKGSGRSRIGTAGPIRYVEDGNYFAGWLSIDESSIGGIREAAEAAYQGLLRLHADSPYRHIWRAWNFITDITDGEGDEERYRQFCLGRARAYAAGGGMSPAVGYPAASAIGRQGGPRSLQLCWIAGRECGVPIENPRQVSAFDYPRQYGPAAPIFSRAVLVPGPLLLVSGTASIVGHASLHDRDLDAQLSETLMNLDALLHRAHVAGELEAARLDARSLIKAYVRHGRDAALVERRVKEHVGESAQVMVLAADICRRELLVEIEAIHGG